MLTDEQALEAMQHPKVQAAFALQIQRALDGVAKVAHLADIRMIEQVLACRTYMPDTVVLNGLESILANHKARVLAMPDYDAEAR